MIIKLICRSCFSKVSATHDLIGKEVSCPACNYRFILPAPQFGFGKVIGGYQLEQWLGSGAMGEVYLARQISMNRQVAFKIIKYDTEIDPEVIDRFNHGYGVLRLKNVTTHIHT